MCYLLSKISFSLQKVESGTRVTVTTKYPVWIACLALERTLLSGTTVTSKVCQLKSDVSCIPLGPNVF